MRFALIALALVACSDHGSRPAGQQGGACLPNGQCDPGLVCFENKCVALDALPLIDAPTGFVCDDDSSLEPNDTIANAFQTPVDTTSQMFTLAGMAICPTAADKDHYAATISVANRALEFVASWDSGTAVSVSILNAGGTSIVNGIPMGTTAVRACAPNLPAGSYFGVVTSTAKQNYRISISSRSSCL